MRETHRYVARARCCEELEVFEGGGRITLEDIRQITDVFDKRERELAEQKTREAADRQREMNAEVIDVTPRPADERASGPPAIDYSPREAVEVDPSGSAHYSLEALDQARALLDQAEQPEKPASAAAPEPGESMNTPLSTKPEPAPPTPPPDPWAWLKSDARYGTPLNERNRHVLRGIHCRLDGSPWQPGEPRPPLPVATITVAPDDDRMAEFRRNMGLKGW